MANKKISQLTSATTPLTGSEQVPLVQSSQTKKATTSDVFNYGGSPLFQPDILYFGGTSCAALSVDATSDGNYTNNIFGSTEINAPNLTTISLAISLTGSNNGQETGFNSPLQTISMPLLSTIGANLIPDMYAIYIEYWEDLTTIDFSSLITSNGKIYIADNQSLTTINLQNLQTVQSYINIYNCDSLISTSFPLLESVSNGIAVRYCNSLTSINIPNLTTCVNGGFQANGNTSLTTLNISSITTYSGYFDASNCALNQTSIDGILNQLANVVVLTNEYVDLSGGTNAAPSVTGATYVAILTGAGCTVTTN
jgi:hypothetical protein